MPYSGAVRCARVPLCLVLAAIPASAHADGIAIIGGSPRAIGRAGVATVGDDGGGAEAADLAEEALQFFDGKAFGFADRRRCQDRTTGTAVLDQPQRFRRTCRNARSHRQHQ